jgi:hypothetical protein
MNMIIYITKKFSSRSSYFNFDTSKQEVFDRNLFNLDACFKTKDQLKFNIVFPYSGRPLNKSQKYTK